MLNPLLTHIIRTGPEPAATALLASRVGDWPALLAEAGPHGLLPLLAWTLGRQCPGVVPSPVLETLQARLRANTQRVLALSAELLRIVEAFSKAGLDMLAFKGPVAAWTLYETPGLREMSDLDLLVRPSDVEAAIEVFRAIGYTPLREGAPLKLFRGGELGLTSTNAAFSVDLHWKLLPPHYGIDSETFFDRAVPVPVAGRPVNTFCPEDLALFTCIHGSKHAWSSLHWLADLIRVIDRHVEAIAPAFERARCAGLSRAFELGISLAHDPGLPLPRDGYRYQFALTGRLGDRLRYAAGLLAPQPADWQALRLPAALYPAYYLIRPVRLALKYTVGRAFRPAAGVPPGK